LLALANTNGSKTALNKRPALAYENTRIIALKRLACLVLLIAFGTLAAPEAFAEDKGLLLKQWCWLVGPTEMTVSKQGVRLNIKDRRLAILMIPPAWDVQFLNLATKVYYQCPAGKWRYPLASTAALARPGDPSCLRSVASHYTLFKGLPCLKHTLKIPTAVDSIGKNTWQGLLVSSGSFYVIDDKFYPLGVSSALERTFGTPQCGGIPVALNCVSHRGEISEEVRLMSHNQVAINVSELQVPKDYKLVKTSSAVTNTDGANQGFSEFIR
jgi:hypothetical protein